MRPTWTWRGAALTLAAASLTMLTACGTTNSTATSTCIVFAPITFSASKDSPETVMQVREHNAAYDEVCE